jgi:hypothetical protein
MTASVDEALVGATFVVTRLHPFDFSGATFGDPLVATVIPAASFTLDLPTPDPGDETLDDSLIGDRLAARFFASVHDDTDGDGVVDTDEVVLAIGDGELVYAEASSMPLAAGWNLLGFGSGGFAYQAAITTIDTFTFTPDAPLTLSGTVTVEGTAPRVAVASVGELLADEPVTTTFAVTLDHRASAFDAGAFPRGALVGLLAYDDLDGSASFSAGDTRLGGACTARGAPAAAHFTDLPRGLDEAFQLYPWIAGVGYWYLPGWTTFEATTGDWDGDIGYAEAVPSRSTRLAIRRGSPEARDSTPRRGRDPEAAPRDGRPPGPRGPAAERDQRTSRSSSHNRASACPLATNPTQLSSASAVAGSPAQLWTLPSSASTERSQAPSPEPTSALNVKTSHWLVGTAPMFTQLAASVPSS